MFVDVCFDVFHTRTSTAAFLKACLKLDPAIQHSIVIVLTTLPPACCTPRTKPAASSASTASSTSQSPPIASRRLTIRHTDVES
jgi:hypothetical protein